MSDYTDYSGLRMTPSVLKRKEIPQQFSSEEEAVILTNISDSLSESTMITSISNAIVSFATSISLSSLWGMINSQQIVV